MSLPRDGLNTQLEELVATLNFISLASSLRPRIGKTLDWGQESVAPELFRNLRSFMDLRDDYLPVIYGALLVRIAAAFEMFLRKLVEAIVESAQRKYPRFEDVPEVLREASIRFTGFALFQKSSPRDHLAFDYSVLIENLATCRPGQSSVRLNPTVFSAGIQGGKPEAIEKALRSVCIEDWWDHVCADRELQSALGAKKSREAKALLVDELENLWRRRNILAHGGVNSAAPTEQELRKLISVIRTFGSALSNYTLTK